MLPKKNNILIPGNIVVLLLLLLLSACTQKPESPNIIYILADDLGYGDVGVYNPESKIATPNIDGFAGQAMRFTDAHSPSSVCTPTRYGILTGTYCWRSQLKQGVLQGYGQSLIRHEDLTVAELLKNHGYTTGVVGKWHLGLDWVLQDGKEDSIKMLGEKPIHTNIPSSWLNFNTPPKNGPLTHGFDYSFILPASLDMDPYCYLENDTLTDELTAVTPGNDLNTGATGAFWRGGLMSPNFDFYKVLPTFIQKASEFIIRNAKSDTPFFLYLPLPAPHTPWVPTEEFSGSSDAGQYGDFVQMVDKYIGELLTVLNETGEAENTLVIIASDNGPYWKPEFIEKFNHRSAANLRGMKADAWDGGHRIPFMVRWPGKIAPGSISDQPTCLTNLTATVADILGFKLHENEAMDSRSILSVLRGGAPNYEIPIVHHSSMGMFAIRVGDWKYIDGLGSGGFSFPRTLDPVDGGPTGQLYNLKDDPGEQIDLAADSTVRIKVMLDELNRIRNSNK
jgi:arylsulfatase A